MSTLKCCCIKLKMSMLFFDKTFHVWGFLDHINTLSADITVHRAGSQLKKNLDIFNVKQRHLSVDMKTKVVQPVPRIIFNVINAYLTFLFLFILF